MARKHPLPRGKDCAESGSHRMPAPKQVHDAAFFNRALMEQNF